MHRLVGHTKLLSWSCMSHLVRSFTLRESPVFAQWLVADLPVGLSACRCQVCLHGRFMLERRIVRAIGSRLLRSLIPLRCFVYRRRLRRAG